MVVFGEKNLKASEGVVACGWVSVQDIFMGDVNSESQALLHQLLADYSEAVARYNAAVLEMTSQQGMVPEKQYDELKAVVSEARGEAARRREALRSFREHFWPQPSNGIGHRQRKRHN